MKVLWNILNHATFLLPAIAPCQKPSHCPQYKPWTMGQAPLKFIRFLITPSHPSAFFRIRQLQGVRSKLGAIQGMGSARCTGLILLCLGLSPLPFLGPCFWCGYPLAQRSPSLWTYSKLLSSNLCESQHASVYFTQSAPLHKSQLLPQLHHCG